MTEQQNRQNGFTLIELIIVVAIIGILAGVAMPRLQHLPRRAKAVVLKENLYAMRSSIDQYLADKGHYPESLEALVEDGYLRRMPEDPVIESSTSWEVIYADAEDDEDLAPTDEEGGGAGIIDVKSTAPGRDFDGRPYSDY